MNEPISHIKLFYSYEDDDSSQSINIEFDGDKVLSEVLRHVQRFLTGIGYGCDELVSRVEVQGDTYEHSSEDTYA